MTFWPVDIFSMTFWNVKTSNFTFKTESIEKEENVWFGMIASLIVSSFSHLALGIAGRLVGPIIGVLLGGYCLSTYVDLTRKWFIIFLSTVVLIEWVMGTWDRKNKCVCVGLFSGDSFSNGSSLDGRLVAGLPRYWLTGHSDFLAIPGTVKVVTACRNYVEITIGWYECKWQRKSISDPNCSILVLPSIFKTATSARTGRWKSSSAHIHVIGERVD